MMSITRRLLAGSVLVGVVTAALNIAIAAVLASPAGADPSPATWAALRRCESGGNYTAIAPNGHYGAYQFDLTTWFSVGGVGQPNQASPTEQDYRALYLYRMRGWQPWSCARSLGLRPDPDAASKRVPTPPIAGIGIPAWPGKVFSYGQCDPALRVWQLRMNAYGFRFDGTGCYRDKTRAAVLAVQRANGIRDSGLLGPRTWRAAWLGNKPTP